MANTLGSFLLPFAIRCEKDTILVFKVYFHVMDPWKSIQKWVLGKAGEASLGDKEKQTVWYTRGECSTQDYEGVH